MQLKQVSCSLENKYNNKVTGLMWKMSSWLATLDRQQVQGKTQKDKLMLMLSSLDFVMKPTSDGINFSVRKTFNRMIKYF